MLYLFLLHLHLIAHGIVLAHYGLDLLAAVLRYLADLPAIYHLVEALLISHLIESLVVSHRQGLIGVLQIVHHLL